MNTGTTEELTNAHHAAVKVAGNLSAAQATATPVEALVLLPIIRRTQELSQDIEQLLSARGAAL